MADGGDVDLDAVISEATQAPAVETGDIEQASFTINRYVVGGDGVEEEEVDTGMSEDEVDALREEISTSVSEKLDAFDDGEDVAPDGTVDLADPTDSEPDPEPEPEPESEPGPDQNLGGEDAVETARVIAEQQDIEPTQFGTFRGAMLDAGFSDDTLQEAWHTLRNEGVIGDADEPDGSDGSGNGSPADTVDVDVSDMDESVEVQEERGPVEAAEEQDGEQEMVEFPPPEGTAVLGVLEGSEASEHVAGALGEAIMAEEVMVIPLGTEAGEILLDPLPSDIKVPFHAVSTGDSFELRDLEDLIEEHLG